MAISISISCSISISIYLYVYLSLSLSISISISKSISFYLSFYLSIFLSIYLTLSNYLSTLNAAVFKNFNHSEMTSTLNQHLLVHFLSIHPEIQSPQPATRPWKRRTWEFPFKCTKPGSAKLKPSKQRGVPWWSTVTPNQNEAPAASTHNQRKSDRWWSYDPLYGKLPYSRLQCPFRTGQSPLSALLTWCCSSKWIKIGTQRKVNMVSWP